MHKYSVIIVSILLIFSACNRTTKEITTNTKDDVVIKDSTPVKKEYKPILSENYDEFYADFHRDSIFQMSRIEFPIQGEYTDEEGVSIAWNSHNWIMHRSPIQSVDTSIYKVEVVNTNNSSDEIIWIEGSGFKTERKFKRIQGIWYLTYYNDDNY